MMSNCVGDVESTTKDDNNEHEWELGNIRCWYDAKDVDPKLGSMILKMAMEKPRMMGLQGLMMGRKINDKSEF